MWWFTTGEVGMGTGTYNLPSCRWAEQQCLGAAHWSTFHTINSHTGFFFFKMLHLLSNTERPCKRNNGIGKQIQKKIITKPQSNLVCKGPVRVSASTPFESKSKCCTWSCPIELWISQRMEIWQPITEKKLFLVFNWNFLDFSLCLLSFVFSLCSLKKNLALSPLYSPIGWLKTAIWSLANLKFLKQNKSDSFNLL